MLCDFDMAKKAQRKEKAAAKTKKRKLTYESEGDDEDEDADVEYEDALFSCLIEDDEEELWNVELNYVPDDTDKENRESDFLDYDEEFTLLTNKEVSVGMWVIVKWEGEKFLGNVDSKKRTSYHVRCLEKPLGICVPQLLEEKGEDYETVFKTTIIPFQVDVDVDVNVGGHWNYVL